MIEIDRTHEEREELVKQWIKDYWLFVVGVVGLSIAVVYGLNHYRQSKIHALDEMASQTDHVMTALNAGDLSTAQEMVKGLQNMQKNSSFAAVATLELGKKFFEKGDYEEAKAHYTWLSLNAEDVVMRDLARLRKARTESNAKQFESAIKTLTEIESKDYVLEATLLKGDIYMANQRFEEAQKAYESLQNEASLSPETIKQRLDLLLIKKHQAS